jgi:mutator protein MutT
VRTHDPSLLVQVAAGVIERDGRYLVARRQANAHLGGHWEFPGGKRERGESLEDCLRRELREELGIEITPPQHCQVVTHVYPDRTVELHFYRCAILSGQPQTLQCEAFTWGTPDELAALPFPPADRPVIERLRKGQAAG